MINDRNMITTALFFLNNAAIDNRTHVAQLFFQKTTEDQCVVMCYNTSNLVSAYESASSTSMKSVLHDLQGYLNDMASYVGGRDNIREFAEEVVSRFPGNFRTSNLSDFPPGKMTDGAMAELLNALRVSTPHARV